MITSSCLTMSDAASFLNLHCCLMGVYLSEHLHMVNQRALFLRNVTRVQKKQGFNQLYDT